MTTQKDDLAEARVALAIKQAAGIADSRVAACKLARDMAREDEMMVRFGIESRAGEAEGIAAAIRAIPHNPEALEAYVDAALEGTFRNGEEVTINGKTYVRRMILFEKGEFHPDHTAIRAMKGECDD